MMEIVQVTRNVWRREVEEQASKDLAGHRLELLGRSGEVVARWRCARDGTSIYGYNVVVWPGAVAIQGDVGDALFGVRERSVADAIAWLRGAVHSCDYLLGKLEAGPEHRGRGDRVLVWPSVEHVLSEMDPADAARFREAWADLGADADGSDYGRLMYELFGDTEGGCSDFAFRPLYLVACLKRFVELLDAQPAEGSAS